MSNSTIKHCSHCKRDFPATTEYFNRNKNTVDGLFHWCKGCKAISDKEYRNSKQGKIVRKRNRLTEKAKVSQRIRLHRFSKTEKGREHAKQSAAQARAKHPERYKARKEIQKAIQRKEMPRAKDCICQKCGNPAYHYHHYLGYEFEHWFDVVPLCRTCHTDEHKAVTI